MDGYIYRNVVSYNSNNETKLMDNISLNSNNGSLTSDSSLTNECSICFNKLNKNIVITSCNHQYHANCLSKWIVKNNGKIIYCPLCNGYLSLKDIEYKSVKFYDREDYIYKKYKLTDNNDNDDINNASCFCCNIL